MFLSLAVGPFAACTSVGRPSRVATGKGNDPDLSANTSVASVLFPRTGPGTHTVEREQLYARREGSSPIGIRTAVEPFETQITD